MLSSSILILVTLMYLVGIAQIYGYYRFNSIKHLLIVEKRYPKLIKIEALVVITYLFLLLPLWTNQFLQGINLGEYIKHIALWSGPIPCHFITNIEAARLLLISFNLNYLNSSKNEAWKSQIDNTFAEKDWYLNNRNTWGNKRYVITRVLIWFLFAPTIPIILFYTVFGFKHYHLYALCDAAAYGVPIIITLYAFYKCPKNLGDNFLFYYEFRATALVFSAGLTIYAINQFFYYLGLQALSHTITALIAVNAGSVPSLLSTIWIPMKISSNPLWSKEEQLVEFVLASSNDKNEQSTELSAETKLSQTLKDAEKFEMFMQFMYCEFSSEAALCLIEFLQFKECFVQFIQTVNNNNIDNIDNDDIKYIVVDYKYIDLLDEKIPKSSIVFSDTGNVVNSMDRFKNSAHLLYKKYLEYDAEYSVNISAKLRGQYSRLDMMNWNVDMLEFVNVFDELIHEMLLFIRNSFLRYDQT